MKEERLFLISMNDHRHSAVSHSDVFVNIRRTLVPLVTIRTLESRFLSAVVFHVRLQCFLIGVTCVTYRTMIGHFARVPEYTIFVLDGSSSPPVLHVRSQIIQNGGVIVRW